MNHADRSSDTLQHRIHTASADDTGAAEDMVIVVHHGDAGVKGSWGVALTACGPCRRSGAARPRGS